MSNTNQNNKKKDKVTLKGVVTKVINGTNFLVLLENNIEIPATISGKMKMFKIQILKGDKVVVELSVYDLTKGRITYRSS